MFEIPHLAYYAFITWVLYLSGKHINRLRELPDIPTYGYSGFFTCWKTAFDGLYDSPKLMLQSYDKYRGAAFKVWTFSGWVVMVSGRDMVEDVRKAPMNQLNFNRIVEEQLQTKYTMGLKGSENIYQIDVVRTTLTRNIGVRFDEMYDEVLACFEDYIPTTEEWLPIPALETSMQIVSRVANRLMVGLPICRIPEYIDLNIHFTVDVFKAAVIINLFPSFLKPIVGRTVSQLLTRPAMRRGRKILGSVISERLKREAEEGKDWPGRPNDLISWLLDHDQITENEKTVEDITMRILTINIAAEHTSHQELIAPLREEMERVIGAEGWTKKAMSSLYQLDSFMKESQRLFGLSSLALSRKALVPFRFSNGVTIPAGTNIGAPAVAIHLDDLNYNQATAFQPFSKQPGFVGEHMVSPKPEYLAFGIGKHVCPGRFLAEATIKLLITYTLLNFDIKLEGGGERPKNMWVGHNMMPSVKAKVLFRKRQQE
ncbi:cytochrome P450 [Flagelloscypha sp. PMI_526]|nr:cytochrome P450 [Flagelloscypha sp. PMI_526]